MPTGHTLRSSVSCRTTHLWMFLWQLEQLDANGNKNLVVQPLKQGLGPWFFSKSMIWNLEPFLFKRMKSEGSVSSARRSYFDLWHGFVQSPVDVLEILPHIAPPIAKQMPPFAENLAPRMVPKPIGSKCL